MLSRPRREVNNLAFTGRRGTSALEADPTDAMESPHAPETTWRFGRFVVWEAQRRLERSGEEVRIGSRSFDLLLRLVKSGGEILSKDELLASVWAGVIVDEGSVRVQMSLLRKALGKPDDGQGCKEWVSSIPLRGYRFNGRVTREEIREADQGTGMAAALAFTRTPVRLTRLIGRQGDIERVLTALDAARLVTIVGPGGIGKTSAAIRAVECLDRSQGAKTAFVDLSPLGSNDHVPSTVTRALGIATELGDAVQAIVRRLADDDVLLLVDNCEHVVDSAAPLLARLLTALPRLRVLATSREALRIDGEHVLRLSALSVPDEEHVTLTEALASPAVQLLVERAASAGARAFDEADGDSLARIVRQIDGIPLAIELVAARLGVQPVRDLASRLNDHMKLNSVDKRAVEPRHATLAATLAWSVALLDDTERRLFRRLSIFRGRFDVESAISIVRWDMDADHAYDALISLANKSLVAFDNDDAIAPYRLLLTTRSYAEGLLAQSDERASVSRQHASLMLDLMTVAATRSQDLGEQEWADLYAFRLDDVRFALEFCMTEPVDAKTAASLTVASAPLWFRVAQVAEYRDRILGSVGMVHA